MFIELNLTKPNSGDDEEMWLYEANNIDKLYEVNELVIPRN